DASKQGRSIEDIDNDAKVSLVDETHGRSDDTEMFDTGALIGDEVFAENDMTEKEHDVIPKEVSTAAPSTIVVSPPVITEVEISLAQTLAELKSAKSKKAEGSRKKSIGKKRAGNEQKQESSKRQRMEDDKETDEHEEADEAEMKKHIEIVQDKEEITIDAIPLTTKHPMIAEYKIVKEGQKGFYHLIRADGSSKRYSSMIKMLQGIDREDLETLWKLVKEKCGDLYDLLDRY
ncbi:hypothetical protein Tco_1536661, partial [Tanacetum coccineum]